MKTNVVENGTYRIRDAATRAGVSSRTVWRWVDSGKVPGVFRVGRCVRINRKLFEQWLESECAR